MTKRFPLTPDLTCPELDGYKLPPIEPEPIGQPLIDYIELKHNQAECTGFIDGYTKAREKYEFTEADIIEAFKRGFLFGADGGGHYLSELLSSLRTARKPIAIEVEMAKVDEYIPSLNPDGTVKGVYVYE